MSTPPLLLVPPSPGQTRGIRTERWALVPSPSQRRVERAWVIANLGYSVLRILFYRQLLADRGLNVWAYVLVELSATLPWSIGSARLVMALAARSRSLALRWGAVATIGFIAPDVFILTTTDRVPPWIYVVIFAWIVVAGALAVRRIRSAVRARRAVDGEPRTPEASPPSRR